MCRCHLVLFSLPCENLWSRHTDLAGKRTISPGQFSLFKSTEKDHHGYQLSESFVPQDDTKTKETKLQAAWVAGVISILQLSSFIACSSALREMGQGGMYHTSMVVRNCLTTASLRIKRQRRTGPAARPPKTAWGIRVFHQGISPPAVELCLHGLWDICKVVGVVAQRSSPAELGLKKLVQKLPGYCYCYSNKHSSSDPDVPYFPPEYMKLWQLNC